MHRSGSTEVILPAVGPALEPTGPAAAVVAARKPGGRVLAILRNIGPGLVTGAADDDPSGIVTYTQAGAAFGYGLGWAVVLTLPFMVAVQEISARIGRVTGAGIAGTLRAHAPRPLLLVIVWLVVVANVINLGADLGGMADVTRLLLGGPAWLYAVVFAVFCVGVEIWVAYPQYVMFLKYLTLTLLAYVALLFAVHVPWLAVLEGIVLPRVGLTRDAVTTLVGVLGTTISPYLFIWQASEEVEDARIGPDPRPLRARTRKRDRAGNETEIARIGFDTWSGMSYSNVVSLSIIVGTAATLHAHGITTIDSAAQAASALAPIAGHLATVIFALGIIGTGLLAVPVLAGSTAYALGEASGWAVGLGRQPKKARAFYGTIAAATLVGGAIVFSPIDPMQALFFSAVINGAVAGPIIVVMVILGSMPRVMGAFVLSRWLRVMGWATAVLMVGTTIAMVVL
ncbi:MAG: divalent metal cation transporter [Proteobacteria bacterium]|nr:divalent metal cation transporter [Pseudomonadota bacterium]